VAYLVAGILVGPGGLGFVSHSEGIGQLAELGVALLLFGVGIEFSLERLRRILPRMIASGALQVAGSVGVTALAFRALALPWPAALFTGFPVSLSSTAIVFKLYDEEGELDAPQGLAAAGILLFQDLTMVPMMLLVPVLASAGGGAARAALGALLEGTTALAAVLVLARAVLFKCALIAAIVGLRWRSGRLAILTGFGLAQIGEFSFVLARQGGAAGVISQGLEQAFLGAAILTMAATPFLMRAARRLGLVG